MIPTNVHWLTKFAGHSAPLLSQALVATASLSSVLRVGEVGLENGRFSLPVLRTVLETFRSNSSKPVELYRVDYGANDHVGVSNLIKSETEGYSHVADVHTYFAMGFLFERIFAPNSLNAIFVSHLLTGVPVVEPAPDTMVPSLSTDEGYRERRKAQAANELRRVLQKRYEELVVGGQLVFDVMGELGETHSFFTLVDEAVNSLIAKGVLNESIRKYGLNTYFREYQELAQVIDEFSSKFKVVTYEHHQVEMPHYTRYKEDGNVKAFAETLGLFWKKVFQVTFSRRNPDSEKLEIMTGQLIEVLEELAEQNPPIVSLGSHHFILEKLA